MYTTGKVPCVLATPQLGTQALFLLQLAGKHSYSLSNRQSNAHSKHTIINGGVCVCVCVCVCTRGVKGRSN